ncbi:hypothetical protein GCM10008922_04890 [Faecalicatena contorta]|uniref:uroporphyrinogen decarboxylase family protein n=1 Tax=Faecalicatena contorta TaxID=39482 RepID=UPI000472EB90
MSYKNGINALHLEMPDKIPRTEYSAHFYWDLIQKVTGIQVNSKSSTVTQKKASGEFIKAWDYGLVWNVLPFSEQFGELRTRMGHANFAQDGADFSDNVHTFIEEPEDVFDFDFFEAYGNRPPSLLTPLFNENYKQMQDAYPDTVNMTGIYTTCMSGVIEILGWDMLLLAAGIDSDEFGSFMNRYAEWNMQYFKALAHSDSPVVMVHDDIVWTQGAFLHPDFYREYIFPNYKKLFAPLHESGKIILYTSDGTYSEFIDDIASCGINGFVMEPTTDMEYICKKYGQTHSIIGNADTRILLKGSKEDIEREVKRCTDLGRNCPGYFLAVGNHIPSNTPLDNCLWYNDMYEKYSRR